MGIGLEMWRRIRGMYELLVFILIQGWICIKSRMKKLCKDLLHNGMNIGAGDGKQCTVNAKRCEDSRTFLIITEMSVVIQLNEAASSLHPTCRRKSAAKRSAFIITKCKSDKTRLDLINDAFRYTLI